jgi:CDP-4-dehydro-6-deoxyglucose reductase/ferredoxin-NAD(P)+ reductase (naphthalene dioxygenase ferredoxin-specific)
MQQDIHLYFAVSDEPDIYLGEHFQTLARTYPNLRFVPVLSEPSGPTERRTGLVSVAVAADFARFNGFKAYLAGPPAMVEAAVQVLVTRGLGLADIHADPFYTEAEKAARNTAC